MASADLRDELLCSICLNIYTDPVTLGCGHNFCRGCIDQVLNTQNWSPAYFCPQCRTNFRLRPTLHRNITLRNIAERLRSTQPHQEEVTGICCTYCIHSPVPAVRSCLHCEASLCDNHLKVHSKSPEHVLTDPSTSLENRKCSIHKKILEYYCTEDAACICTACCLLGEHRGHEIQSLEETSERKKKEMRNVLKKMATKREETEERVQSLEKRTRKSHVLFTHLRKQVGDLEKKVLAEISRQEAQVSDMVQKLEIKKDELSRKMRHIEELCNMTDPLTVLQEPDTCDLCDPEEEGGDEDTGGHDKTHNVDVDVITEMLHAGFSDIMTYLQTISPATPGNEKKLHHSDPSPPSHAQASPVSGTEYGVNDVIVRTGGAGGEGAAAGEGGIYGQGPADILLDVNTAHNNLLISDDLKTVTWTHITQKRAKNAERFQNYQVMSSRKFTTGQHYWDVEIRRSDYWKVGMCYPSIDRKGYQSYFGFNNKSWCLRGGEMYNYEGSVIHDGKDIPLPYQICSDRVRICLDYEAGELSFYELRDTIIIPIHTFTATFTKPLHAAFYVCEGSIKILGERSSCEEPSS